MPNIPIFSPISFEDILPIWKHKLWPERESLIEPISYINSDGQIDVNIINWAVQPIFFGLHHETQIIACVSGFQTSLHEVRCRGIWVDPQFRKQHLATQLINCLTQHYTTQKYLKIMWTMARLDSVKFYEKCGFHAYKKISQYEYGPHQLMQLKI